MAWNTSNYSSSGGRPGGGKGNSGGGRNFANAPAPLPQEYLEALKTGYYRYDEESGKDVLRREYIYGYPARLVECFGQGGTDKSSQVRKFYDHVVRIREKLDGGASFAEVEADFCMLAAFAKNAKERRTVSENFRRFIQVNVDAVQSKEDFAAFAKHFEAVIAYLKK